MERIEIYDMSVLLCFRICPFVPPLLQDDNTFNYRNSCRTARRAFAPSGWAGRNMIYIYIISLEESSFVRPTMGVHHACKLN